MAPSARRFEGWARHQIAFFAQIPYFEVILSPHDLWKPAEAIREAALTGDVQAMVGAVTDEMVDKLTVAGTPEGVPATVSVTGLRSDRVGQCPPPQGLNRKM